MHREMDPEGAGWDVNAYLLANVVDMLAAANWQRGNTGAKTPSPKPQPMYRPPAKTVRRRKTMDERIAEFITRKISEEGGTDGR